MADGNFLLNLLETEYKRFMVHSEKRQINYLPSFTESTKSLSLLLKSSHDPVDFKFEMHKTTITLTTRFETMEMADD